MHSRSFTVTAFLSLVAASAIAFGPDARAEDGARCGHPSMTRGATCAAAGIDPNTFLVQPPASTQWMVRASHANGDHPAVVVARLQRVATVDANTFLVQPPVAVVWTVQQPVTLMAAAPVVRR